MFGFVELHVNTKDLGEARLREDLVPFGIHNLPLGDQVHTLRRAISNLIGSGFAIQREHTLAHFTHGKDGSVLTRFLAKAKKSHVTLLLVKVYIRSTHCARQAGASNGSGRNSVCCRIFPSRTIEKVMTLPLMTPSVTSTSETTVSPSATIR